MAGKHEQRLLARIPIRGHRGCCNEIPTGRPLPERGRQAFIKAAGYGPSD
jgi:hypothetical protein